ncbi:MAG: hypothetical protein ACXVGB_13830 [Mycobacteriaceae bacterium]
MSDPSTWAKAPDFSGRRELAAKIHAATAADKELYNSGGLQPVDCRACSTRVLVKKFSPQHTSIQWTSDPLVSCPELRAGAEAGRETALQDTCPRLRASIEYAVAEGLLHVGRPDDEEDTENSSA